MRKKVTRAGVYACLNCGSREISPIAFRGAAPQLRQCNICGSTRIVTLAGEGSYQRFERLREKSEALDEARGGKHHLNPLLEALLLGLGSFAVIVLFSLAGFGDSTLWALLLLGAFAGAAWFYIGQ